MTAPGSAPSTVYPPLPHGGCTRNRPWSTQTHLKDPAKYHITALYSPNGYANASYHRWLAERPRKTFAVRAQSVRAFDPGDDEPLTPMVLVLDAPELVEAALALRASAQRQGLSIQQHAEGFMPHVTLAVCAHTPVFELIKQPSLLLTTARLIELHSRYDALALRESEISEKALDVGDAVADITL